MGRKKGVLFSYLLMLVEVVSSLLFTPFLIRTLGQAEYGVYSLSLSITAYFALLDLGVGNALVRYISKFRTNNDYESQSKFIGLSLAFYAAIFIVVIGLFVLLSNNMNTVFGDGLTTSELELAKSLLGVTVVNTGLSMIFSVFDKVIISYEYFAVSKVLQIIKILLRVSVQVFLLLLGFGSLGIVFSNLALTALFGIASLIFVCTKLGVLPRFRGFELSFAKEVIGYSSFIFIQMVATQINAMADQVLLGMMTSSVVLGVYAVGSQINQYYQSIAGSINGVTMPGIVKMVEMGAQKQDLMGEMVKIGRIVLIVLGIIMGGFLVFGDWFVSLWAGNENEAAFRVAAILMLPFTLSLIQSPGTQVLWSMGKHQVQAYIKIVVAVANIALTIALIKWDPLLGAAIGTAISCFFGDVVAMNVVFRRYIGINMSNYYAQLFKGIIPCVVLSCAAGLIFKALFPGGWWYLLIGILLVLIFYGSLMALFGANEYEKYLVRSFIQRIKPSQKGRT